MLFEKPISILIIDDNSSFVLSLLRCFSGRPDIQLFVLLSSMKKPNYFRYSRYLGKIYRKELTEENFEKTVKEIVNKTSADLIIPTREWISKLIYQNRHSLEKIVKIHPVSDVNTIETVNDKRRLNNWLKNNKFPSSLTININKEPELNSVIDFLSFPVLLKPALSLGGEGIKLVNNPENLKSIFASDGIYEKNYFIQEYINGYDIGVNIFSINGRILCHTIQKALFPNQLTYSRGTEFVRNPELLDLASSIVGKLKYSGVANLDFRFDSGKGTFILIDFNARYWSTLDGSRFMGVNFPLLVAAYCMGIRCNCPEYSAGTYYCTKAAITTFTKNLFSKRKYPINLRHTKLAAIALDPVPEIIRAGEVFIDFIKMRIARIKKPKL